MLTSNATLKVAAKPRPMISAIGLTIHRSHQAWLPEEAMLCGADALM